MTVGRRAMRPAVAHVEVDRNVYPTRGIDVSAHNGEIDFDRVAADSIRFVYIKASEGGSWRDASFERNYSKATEAGLHVGAYHFFRFDVEGWRQSVNLLRALGHKTLTMPVAIDVEEWGNPAPVSTDHVVDHLRSMIELLRQNGREAVIYTNKNGYYRFIRGRFDDVDLWICSFTTPPMPENRRWTMWQHSHTGIVDGVPGPVDLITFNTPVRGTFDDWISRHPCISSLK